MARPKCCRRVGMHEICTVFKPAGTPLHLLEEVLLSLDELEALRLADFNGLSHEAAAKSMHVSRQTFGRIVSSARGKTALALIEGRALRIGGGVVQLEERRHFGCRDCCTAWEWAVGDNLPEQCPACGSPNLCRKRRKGAATRPARASS